MIAHRFFSSRIRLCTALSAAIAATFCGAHIAGAACLSAPAGQAVEVTRIDGDGELVLADGRTLRLVGVAPIDATAMAVAIRHQVRAGARIAAIADKPDRWGRYDAQVAVPGASGMVSLIEPLVAEGFAIWRADSVAAPRRGNRASAAGISAACATRLAALEEGARLAARGSWAAPAPMPLSAGDIPNLKQYQGRFVVVTGRVVSVGERRATTFVNFGRVWNRDFFVEIPRADWEKMAQEGITAKKLEGRKVMVRGDLVIREIAAGPERRNTGGAPAIRLSVARSISVLDMD